MKKRIPILSLSLLGLDLFFKYKTEKKPDSQKETALFGEKILIRKVHNHGMAFNILDREEKIVKATSAGSAVLLLLTRIWYGRFKKGFGQKAGLDLMLAGGLSNLYDRFFRGYVVDYIGFPFKKERIRNLTFNIGDFCLAAGVLLLGASAAIAAARKRCAALCPLRKIRFRNIL